MNKQQFVNKIIELLEQEVLNLSNAAKIAHADATGEESKAENKYDTRGLEASYLAGAQAVMASDSAQNLSCYSNMQISEFTNDSKIALTAFIGSLLFFLATYFISLIVSKKFIPNHNN